MKFLFLLGFGLLLGCQKTEEVKIPVQMVPVKPSSEYPKSVESKDRMMVSLWYVDKDADTAMKSVEKEFPIGKYVVEADSSLDYREYTVEDQESVVLIRVTPSKDRISNIFFSDWLVGNIGKNYRVEMHYFDRKAQGYPANMNFAKDNGVMTGKLIMGEHSSYFDIESRPMLDPVKNRQLTISRVSVSIGFFN